MSDASAVNGIYNMAPIAAIANAVNNVFLCILSIVNFKEVKVACEGRAYFMY